MGFRCCSPMAHRFGSAVSCFGSCPYGGGFAILFLSPESPNKNKLRHQGKPTMYPCLCPKISFQQRSLGKQTLILFILCVFLHIFQRSSPIKNDKPPLSRKSLSTSPQSSQVSHCTSKLWPLKRRKRMACRLRPPAMCQFASHPVLRTLQKTWDVGFI